MNEPRTGGCASGGKDPDAERLAARAIRAEKRPFEQWLHERHMTLVGQQAAMGNRHLGARATWRPRELCKANVEHAQRRRRIGR